MCCPTRWAPAAGNEIETCNLRPESNYTPDTVVLRAVAINLPPSLAMTTQESTNDETAKANTTTLCSMEMQTLHSSTLKVFRMICSHSCTIFWIAFDILGGETGYLQRCCVSSTIRLSSSLQQLSFSWLQVGENIL